MKKRCVNLDWLEIHALEPVGRPHNADYFRALGIYVEERDYGTRVYREMFTVFIGEQPFLEVRRNPASDIIVPESCHIRLVNRSCYMDNAVTLLRQFLTTYDYTFDRVYRVDICLDFERFDSLDDPQQFIQRYMAGRYSKINQANVHSHGSDTWNARTWNSLSWGADTSDIGTKIYNKTLELYDPTTKSYKKPYIREAWLHAGLIDDMTSCQRIGKDGKPYTPAIWRVEFSIRSSVKKWFVIELNGKRKAYQSIRNTLDMYDTRPKLLMMFASLANHYFHFKHYKANERKDRCPDKVLFKWEPTEICYKVGKDPAIAQPENHSINTLLTKLRALRERKLDKDIRQACNVLIKALEDETLSYDLCGHFSLSELTAMRVTLARRSRGEDTNYTAVMHELKELLKINDNTAIF